jgi:hypothetical protein
MLEVFRQPRLLWTLSAAAFLVAIGVVLSDVAYFHTGDWDLAQIGGVVFASGWCMVAGVVLIEAWHFSPRTLSTNDARARSDFRYLGVFGVGIALMAISGLANALQPIGVRYGQANFLGDSVPFGITLLMGEFGYLVITCSVIALAARTARINRKPVAVAALSIAGLGLLIGFAHPHVRAALPHILGHSPFAWLPFASGPFSTESFPAARLLTLGGTGVALLVAATFRLRPRVRLAWAGTAFIVIAVGWTISAQASATSSMTGGDIVAGVGFAMLGIIAAWQGFLVRKPTSKDLLVPEATELWVSAPVM